MRALDILRGLEVLSGRTDLSLRSIRLEGRGAGSVPALFAAALDDRIKSVSLHGMLISWRSVVSTRIHRHAFEQVIPGVLRSFDLPDLVAAMGPARVKITGLVDAMGDSVPDNTAVRVYGGSYIPK